MKRRLPLRTVLAAVGTVVAVLCAPAVVVAAPIEVSLSGAPLKSLVAHAEVGDETDHRIAFDSVPGGFRVRDEAGATAGMGCSPETPTSTTSVVCQTPPEDLGQIFLHGAAGDDLIVLLDIPPARPGPGGPKPSVYLEGRLGADTLRAAGLRRGIKQRGGPGADRLHGSGGSDVLNGGPGGDRLFGNGGGDFLIGEGGPDLLVFGPGRPGPGFGLWGRFANLAYGGAGNDRLYGREARDELHGGKGFDRIFGRRGHDRLLGEQGIDRLFSRDFQADQISCGAGDSRREHVRGDGRDIRPHTLRRRDGDPLRLRISC